MFDRRRLRPLARLLATALIFVAMGGVSAARATEDANLRVGAAKIDITPTNLAGLNPMGGGAFEGVHDPIFARALVLSNGRNTAAIVSTDLIEVGDMTPLRRRIQAELGIPFNNIMISATHDHSAPRIGEVSPGALAHPGGAESKIYTQLVYDRIVAALKQAQASAQPARFGLLTGEANVNVNRDLYTSKGWTMGFNADGPSNKTVWVLKFETPNGKPIAVLFNYAVHDDVTLMTNQVSGDLSGVAEHYVEQNIGDGVVALWTLGPAGDQDPRVFPIGPRNPKHDPALQFQAADAQGVMVGAEVVRVANLIQDMTGTARIEADAREVSCPTKQGVNQMADMTQVHVPDVTLHLGMILLNRVALVGVSGEVVTNIYTHLAKVSPLADTVMITIANDRVGYIPDDAAYDRPIFEVNGSPMARGCAESAIVGGLTDMINAHLR